MAKGKLAIGFASGDQVSSPFLYSLVTTLNEDWRTDKRIRGRVIQVRSGPMIDQARNDIVRAFLDMDDRPDWLLMLDADMTWSPAELRRLFEAADEVERPVIGGLCFAGHLDDARTWPVLLSLQPPAEGEGPSLQRITEYPRDAICQVDATGAAFLLIHRGVLERMEAEMGPGHVAPWFFVSYMPGIRFGEDVSFCLRLMKMHIPVHVHTGVRIGHVKTRVLTEAVYDASRAPQAASRLLRAVR